MNDQNSFCRSLNPAAKLMRPLLVMFLVITTPSWAGITITVDDTGGSTTMTATGQMNGNALYWANLDTTNDGGRAGIAPSQGIIQVGQTNGRQGRFYRVRGPASFGAGDVTLMSGYIHDAQTVGIYGSQSKIFLNNTAIAFTEVNVINTYPGKDIQALGLTPGTYTWTTDGGTDHPTDTIVLVIKPSSSQTPATGVPTPNSTAITTTSGVPGQPVIESAVPGNTSIAVSWTKPDDNGTPITSYTVQYSTDPTSKKWQSVTTGSCTSIDLAAKPLGCTIPGLVDGTPYYIQVAATNAVGTGKYAQYALQTPSVPTPTPTPSGQGPSYTTITANPDVYTTPFSIPLTAPTDRSSGLLGNDINCQSVRVATQPNHGTLTLNANGGFSYTPQEGFHGTDSFTYVGVNGSLESSPATVSIRVGNPSPTASSPASALPPIANPDAWGLTQDVTLNVPNAGTLAAGVLANDADPQGYPLTASVTGWPTHGSLAMDPHGGFSYTPLAGYVGRDSFSYSVSNGVMNSTATVLLIVEAKDANEPPFGNPDAYATLRDTPFTVPWPGVLGNDYDPEGVSLTASVNTQPAHGSVSVGPYGRVSYIPQSGYVGKDSFTYVASDGIDQSGPITVMINVNDPAKALPPVANPDAWSVAQDGTLLVREPKGVLANDYDPSGNQIQGYLLSQPKNGLLGILEGGGFIYTPNYGFSGIDSFTYLVTDGLQNSAPTTVTLRVNATNRTPSAQNLSFPLQIDETLNIPPSKGVFSKVLDPEGHLLGAVITAQPRHGVLVPEADGGMVYIPATGFTGRDNVGFSVTDGQLSSAPANIQFTVKTPSRRVLKDPKAGFDRYTLPSSGVLNVPLPGLLKNDRDPQKDPLLVYLASAPAHGSLHLGLEGDFRYYPDVGFKGRDSFRYRVFDGIGSSKPARVWLNVKPSNKAPTARGSLFRSKPRASVINVPTPGLLRTAKNVGGFFLTPSIAEYPSHGLLRLEQNGSFIYYPDAGFKGIDSFSWKVTNDLQGSKPATSILNCGRCGNQ